MRHGLAQAFDLCLGCEPESWMPILSNCPGRGSFAGPANCLKPLPSGEIIAPGHNRGQQRKEPCFSLDEIANPELFLHRARDSQPARHLRSVQTQDALESQSDFRLPTGTPDYFLDEATEPQGVGRGSDA